MFLFLMVVVSSSWLESASDECTCDDRSSDLATPSSGPTICLPFDDYLQLRQEATASAVSDEETVSYVSGCTVSYQYVLQTDALPPTSVSSTQVSMHPLSNPTVYVQTL